MESIDLSNRSPKGVNLNGIVLDKSTQKDMVTDEFGVPNDVLRMLLRTNHKYFSFIK